MDALGLLDAALVGHETAGFVTRLGPGTEESGLKVGDRVCALAKGLFASKSHIHWKFVAKIPDDMSFEDAAAIPTIFVTAYHSLFPVARLRKRRVCTDSRGDRRRRSSCHSPGSTCRGRDLRHMQHRGKA